MDSTSKEEGRPVSQEGESSKANAPDYEASPTAGEAKSSKAPVYNEPSTAAGPSDIQDTIHPIPDEDIENLPVYSTHDTNDPDAPLTLTHLSHLLQHPQRLKNNDIHLWRRYLSTYVPDPKQDFESAKNIEQGMLLKGFFQAVEEGQSDIIEFLVTEKGLVDVNATYMGQTPLFKAVERRNVEVVRQLIGLGAEVDGWSPVRPHHEFVSSQYLKERIQRTPLQQAASIGHLVLVRLLMEEYNANDALIALDGQIALRLAVENNHPEIVAYLPARRSGGFLRWKYKNRTTFKRIKHSLENVAVFVKFFVWDIEKFFLWTVPKHVVVKPLIKGSLWAWRNKRAFGRWCVRVVKGIPGAVKEFGIELWRILKDLPEVGASIVKWVWKVLKRVPSALLMIGRWIGNGLTSLAKWAWNLVRKIVSMFVTAFGAVITFFRNLTLKDVWNGIVDVGRALWNFARLIGSWISAFGDNSFKLLKLLFGCLGEVIWWLGWLVMFVPMHLWKILKSIGGSLKKAGHEIVILVNPKVR